MKKTIVYSLTLAILLSMIPSQKVAALKPPRKERYEYTKPQDFVRWINNKSMAKSESFFEESIYQKYIDTYKINQDYILAPEISGATVYGVYWDNLDVSIHYQFSDRNIDWSIDVYPVKAYNKTHFPQDIAGDLESRYRAILEHSHENAYTVTDAITGEAYMQSQSVEKKKLKLAYTTVDCMQEVWRWKNEKNTLEQVFFDFITQGMYVQVNACGMTANKLKFMTQIMGECSFKKIYTNPRLRYPKNMFIKKQSRIYTMLYNPTKELFTHIKFYIYDKKRKRYQLVYCKKVAKKNRNKQNVSINLDIKKCLKKGRKQLGRKKVYPVKKRQRYRHRIRVKVGAKYYDVTGSFRLK